MIELKQLAEGYGLEGENDEPSVQCTRGKQYKLPFQKNEIKTKNILELLHTDLCGPMQVPSIGG